MKRGAYANSQSSNNIQDVSPLPAALAVVLVVGIPHVLMAHSDRLHFYHRAERPCNSGNVSQHSINTAQLQQIKVTENSNDIAPSPDISVYSPSSAKDKMLDKYWFANVQPLCYWAAFALVLSRNSRYRYGWMPRVVGIAVGWDDESTGTSIGFHRFREIPVNSQYRLSNFNPRVSW